MSRDKQTNVSNSLGYKLARLYETREDVRCHRGRVIGLIKYFDDEWQRLTEAIEQLEEDIEDSPHA